MIIQPVKESRNMTVEGYEHESQQIELLNKVLGDVELTMEEEQSLLWLCGWERSTLLHIISAFRKSWEREQRQLN